MFGGVIKFLNSLAQLVIGNSTRPAEKPGLKPLMSEEDLYGKRPLDDEDPQRITLREIRKGRPD